jgi:hypothetical protein
MEKAEDESEKAELKQELSALESKLKKIDIVKNNYSKGMMNAVTNISNLEVKFGPLAAEPEEFRFI